MAKTRKNIRCFSRDLTAFLNIFHFIHRNSGFQRKRKENKALVLSCPLLPLMFIQFTKPNAKLLVNFPLFEADE